MMPLIVSWPGVTKPGSVNDDLVQNLDYAPTFLDIAGVKPPATMQGRSLVPLLEGKTPPDWRESLYYHYYGYPAVHMVPRHCGVRTKNHKLMNFYQFGEWEFYDLKSDPDEIQNLYNKDPQSPQIEELKKELVRLQDLYQDETDLKEKPEDWKQQFRGGQ